MKLAWPFLMLCCVFFAACLREPKTTPSGHFVATTTHVCDAMRTLLPAQIELRCLMKPGVDPHLYQATPSDMEDLLGARAVVSIGLHLEGRLAELLRSRDPMTHVALGNLVPEKNLLFGGVGGKEADPHFWMDPMLWGQAIQALAVRLQVWEPTHATAIEENAKRFRAQLLDLDSWARAQFALLPVNAKYLITTHDAFAYFGRAYGLQVESLQGLSTAAEVGAQDFARVLALVKQKKVPALFVEHNLNPKLIERLVSLSGATLGGKLYADSLGTGNTSSFEGAFRWNVETIMRAMQSNTNRLQVPPDEARHGK